MKEVTINNLSYKNIYNNFYLISEYEIKLKSYNKYCKEEEKENWNKAIDELLKLSIFEPTIFESEIRIFEIAAQVMELFANGYTDKEIKGNIYWKYFSCINKILHKYSIYEIKYPNIRYYEEIETQTKEELVTKIKKKLKKK